MTALEHAVRRATSTELDQLMENYEALLAVHAYMCPGVSFAPYVVEALVVDDDPVKGPIGTRTVLTPLLMEIRSAAND